MSRQRGRRSFRAARSACLRPVVLGVYGYALLFVTATIQVLGMDAHHWIRANEMALPSLGAAPFWTVLSWLHLGWALLVALDTLVWLRDRRDEWPSCAAGSLCALVLLILLQFTLETMARGA